MPKDYVSEYEVLRSFATPGSPSEAKPVNPIDSDPVLRGLIALRDLHSDPARWCGGREATDFPRNSCIAEGADLVAGWGGWDEANTDFDGPLASAIVGALTPHLPDGVGLIKFNEGIGTTHAQLLAFYDRAIQARKGA